jgi:N-acetylglucosamine kinase-like BadF-type ATPase
MRPEYLGRMDVRAGIDAGGSGVRVAIATLDGQILRQLSLSGGANPYVVGSSTAGTLVNQALLAVRRADEEVISCCIGLAGHSKLDDPQESASFHAEFSNPVTVFSDAEIAFASATTETAGTIVIAGTGSIVARITNNRMTATAGGYGWLLGDEGSAFGVGRAAVRKILRILDSGVELRDGPLHIAQQLAGATPTRSTIIAAANSAPPTSLACLAPHITSLDEHDPFRLELLREAGTALAALITPCTGPIVAAGSLAPYLLDFLPKPVLNSMNSCIGALRLAAMIDLTE